MNGPEQKRGRSCRAINPQYNPPFDSVRVKEDRSQYLRQEYARAPTRSPQGQRARQNAAKNPADLHAESRPRRVGARNGQPPAQAAPSRASGGAVAEAGAAIPERREAERGSSVAARQRRA